MPLYPAFPSHSLPGARALCFVLALMVSASAGAATEDMLFETVAERARSMAQEPHTPPQTELPPPLAELGYDAYRDIRFRREHALWRDQGLFEVHFFHRGFLYREPVRINVVEDGEAQRLGFDPTMFDYGENPIDDRLPTDLGFAGFRIHYPLNRPDYKDEVAVFLGASYFRLIGRGQVYGMSARGLAVDTGLQKGEEFPLFREFWLVRPGPEATSVTLYALLDSESVTGAYRFDIHPGADTVVDVRAELFARSDIERLGIAPLTSMFLHGEQRLRRFDDFRPEVHDSDGLAAHTQAGEWIWRPLENPQSLKVTTMVDTGPRGFGLMQRDRDFDHYLDMEAHYERRPGIWVEPKGDWGHGAIFLAQIPTQEEINDNIVAFWVPDGPFRAGASREVAYRLHTTSSAAAPGHRLAYAARTHVGWARKPGVNQDPPRPMRRLVIDFEGDELSQLDPKQPVEANLSTSSGEVSEVGAYKLPGGQWRASFRLMPEDGQPADMRLYLSLRGQRLSETWSYVWSSDAVE